MDNRDRRLPVKREVAGLFRKTLCTETTRTGAASGNLCTFCLTTKLKSYILRKNNNRVLICFPSDKLHWNNLKLIHNVLVMKKMMMMMMITMMMMMMMTMMMMIIIIIIINI